MNEETMQEWSDRIELDERLKQAELDERMESVAEQDAEVCDCWQIQNFAQEYEGQVLVCQECGSVCYQSLPGSL